MLALHNLLEGPAGAGEGAREGPGRRGGQHHVHTQEHPHHS
jgi:hypothetical protein